MRPVKKTGAETPVFVGNNHFGGLRPIVELAIKADVPIDVWGRQWESTEASKLFRGNSVPNERLGELYAFARAVLCDQTPVMARNGFVSNRVYDALACAAPVIMTPVAELPDAFKPFIYSVETPEDFCIALQSISKEGDEGRKKRFAFAERMIATDSFGARAETLLEAAASRNLIQDERENQNGPTTPPQELDDPDGQDVAQAGGRDESA